ncbi:unnamed protein product [Coregonus sp. 'balchen']|nr:unnamed protein product [Coregonus sp. 'balchen']
MAQMRKSGCDGIRTNSRAELRVPQMSARQEILTSLVSALESVLNAQVACITVHEDSVIAVGTEKGRAFLNSQMEIQTDFHKFCRVPCLQGLTTVNAHAKVQESESSKLGKEGGHGKQRASTDAHSNIFVLRKMVEEVFSVLYSEAVGKSNSLVPVPYEWILKDPSCVVAHGLPEGITLRKPAEYNTKTLMKILEQSNRIYFTVKRGTEEPLREAKSSAGNVSNHNSSSGTTKILANHGPASKPSAIAQEAPTASVSASNSMLSSFLYAMPMSSQPHPDGKLDLKPTTLLNLDKDRLGAWVAGAEKGTAAKDSSDNGLQGELGQSPPSIHVSKRLLFSIVHEKSEKWDSFIRETEDINTLRECVQILFNSRYAEALGLDHMVPVPYRKIACDPEAVEIIGIPDKIPFKRPCTYGVPKLKCILEERHGVRFLVKRMFDERIFTAAGKVAKEEGKHDINSTFEDGFPDSLRIPSAALELVTNPHSSRSTSSCVSLLAECEADASVSVEERSEPQADPAAAAVLAVATLAQAAPHRPLETHAAEALSSKPASLGLRRSSEGNLAEDIGEIILQLRRQVESLFSTKYAEALGLPESAKVPYSKFQMYPDELCVTGLPEGMTFRRPNCFGAAKLRKILAVGSQIQFVIKRPELLTDQVKLEPPPLPSCDSDSLEAKLSRIDLANTLREQVQDLFNRRYGEALGIKYPVQVPYKRIKSNPGSVIIEGLPPGIPFRKPCTFGSQNLERILAVADKICFTITRPFQGLIPKPDEEEVNRIGEKVILREQLIRASPDSVEVSGLPDDIPFRNPNTYDIVRLEKILQARDEININIKSQLQPFAEICTQTCNTEKREVSTNRRKRKRVLESSRVSLPSESGVSTNQIPVMQWPMYMVDYSGVNVQVHGKVKY